jgi:hypothetical protein
VIHRNKRRNQSSRQPFPPCGVYDIIVMFYSELLPHSRTPPNYEIQEAELKNGVRTKHKEKMPKTPGKKIAGKIATPLLNHNDNVLM